MLSVKKLRHHHVCRLEKEVKLAASLCAPDENVVFLVILLNDFCGLWQTQGRNVATLSDDAHFVVELVGEFCWVADPVASVVGVEGTRKVVGERASDNFELANDRLLEHCFLPWEQVSKRDAHCRVILLRHDRGLARRDGIVELLLRLLLFHDLGRDDPVVDHSLELGKDGRLFDGEDIRALEGAIHVWVHVPQFHIGYREGATDLDSI